MAGILVLSDLHTEFGRHSLSYRDAVERDRPSAIVLPGDIGKGVDAVFWASQAFPEWIPVALIPGNHEYYGGDLEGTLAAMRDAAEDTPNVSVLDRDVLAIETEQGRFRILGATLWTDFRYNPAIAPEHAMRIAQMRMNDFRLITYAGRRFTAADSVALHERDLAWLDQQLRLPFSGATIVATHHAPSTVSAHPRYLGGDLNPAFGSNLDAFILEHQPEAWLHGHTHWSIDANLGFTRIVSRQLGYPGEGLPEIDLSPIEIPLHR